MNKFTDLMNLVEESRRNYDSGSLLSSEISKYLTKVNKVIPKIVQDVIYLTQKYNLLDAESIDDIRNASKSSLKNLSTKYNIDLDNLENLWKLLKDIKSNIKLLPQFQTAAERESIELGKLSMNDLTIDLDTLQGRNAAAKMYMPMIYKIVNQYVGKSNLDKQELISAALKGFTDAMNDWKRPGKDDDEKKVVFKTYAAYRAKQQILNDMNELSHDLSGGNWYNTKKYGTSAFDATSIDAMASGGGRHGGDSDGYDIDHMDFLGSEDANYNLTDKSGEKQWKTLYELIEKTFKQRDVVIFYRYFGLHGYKREKSKDIAKSMGMSEGNIKNSIINKMIAFLKKDKKAISLLQDIRDVYNESLMVEMLGMDSQQIMETLINDDIYILLEELNRWSNKDVFTNALNNSMNKLDEAENETITNILESNFEYLDSRLKKDKKTIIKFLNNMYPSENMSRKTDVSILEYMDEIQTNYKKYYLK